MEPNQNSKTNPSTEETAALKGLPWFLGGALLGAIAMYFLDPVQGHRRRILARDKGVHLKHETLFHGSRIARNIKNRMHGLRARMERRKTADQPVDDDILVQRIRSEFGRKVRHAKAIQVSAGDGIVVLSGPILASEVKNLIRCVERVPGVREVVSRLDVHQTSEKVPALQGEGKPYLQ